MTGQPYVLRILGSGLRKPKNRVPGTDVAGHVELVGTKVTRFRPGDEVFGQSFVGNLWRHGGAAFAAIPEYRLERKPAGITFEQAAAIPTSGSLAAQGVRDEGRTQPGQKVLINGAGGAVGTFALQLAKAFGAEVTGVDATEKLDMLRSIGADRVGDYTQEDFTRSGERYDFILDLAGTTRGPSASRRSNPMDPPADGAAASSTAQRAAIVDGQQHEVAVPSPAAKLAWGMPSDTRELCYSCTDRLPGDGSGGWCSDGLKSGRVYVLTALPSWSSEEVSATRWTY